MDVGILYEDAEVIVVNKPPGLAVHADGKTKEPTLVDWLIARYPSIKGVGESMVLADGRVIERPGIVHRLDRETSGAMVVAKTQSAFQALKKQFKNRSVQKRYHLFVYGELKDERGIIDRPIGRSARDFRQWTASRGARGVLREAVTWFKVLKRTKGFTFVEAQPRTGRTHQIRVHFKALNHPIVSDSLYAPNQSPALGFSRAALHAYSIKFESLAKEVEVIAPYPRDFENAVEFLK